MSPMLEAALEYAELGHHPLPLSGKTPNIKRWPTRNLSDRRAIRRWWKRWPDANVGLRTGAGLFVLDVDRKNGGYDSFESLCRGRKLPETVTALTGDGGRHFWFQVPPPEKIGCCQCFGGFKGLDIRGEGGFVVVEPSIHPDTGRCYVWTRHLRSGVARCPNWLLRELARGRKGLSGWETVPLPDEVRDGQHEILAAGLIWKFPVPGFGHRNQLMVPCIGSVLGGGYDDFTVIEAVTAWWVHYYDLGRVATPPSDARTEILKTIAVLRSSPRFGRARSGINHLEACRSINLSESQISKLRGEIPIQSQDNTKRVTLTRARLCEKLCVSTDDLAFAEALIVQSSHKLATDRDGLVRMTDDQVREIVSDRHPTINWLPQQFERLKAKYITRPSKPARRFEMLVELEKGHRGRGQSIGTPSIYRPTGIMGFL